MVGPHPMLNPDRTASDSPGRTSHVRWNILALLTLLSFVAYLLRTNMSIAGERMMGDLGLSQVQLGWVLAAFAWGYAIFQFPGGLLGEWLGGRKALTLIAVLWGILNLLIVLVPGSSAAGPVLIITSLAALRFLMGAAQAPVFPVLGGHTIARWFPVSGWAFPNALTNMGLTLGAAATGPLIVLLIRSFGWRWSFALTAPLAFLCAGVWWWYGRDDPSQHPAVGPQELELINADRPSTSSVGDPRAAWRLVLRNREVTLITASYFFNNYVFYFFFNWLYIYLVEIRKFEELQGGVLAAAPWVAGAFAAVFGGWTCDRLSRRYGIRLGCRLVVIVGLLLAGAFVIAAGAASSPSVAVIYLSLCLGSQQFTDSAYWAAATSVGGRHSAAACGVMNTGGNAVGGIVALLVPFTARALGWPAALATASLFAFVGAGLWLWIRADRSIDDPSSRIAGSSAAPMVAS
ncbi:MAG TPA: MFS transporter [Gemmatimonadales bacterium]|nr:MFS transporter [Gemmatimonadales bacterium]